MPKNPTLSIASNRKTATVMMRTMQVDKWAWTATVKRKVVQAAEAVRLYHKDSIPRKRTTLLTLLAVLQVKERMSTSSQEPQS